MELPIRPPLFVHHMAALDDRLFPPNSLEAIRASLEYGAACIEVDITALADGDYLLVHDPDLDSETTGAGPVGGCTAREADSLFFKVAGAATAYRVPTLSQVVALFQAYPDGAQLQLDFKNTTPLPADEPLHRLARLIEPLGERVIVSSEADWQLRRLHRIAPWLELGFDIHFYIERYDSARPRDPQHYPRQSGAYGYYDDYPLAAQRIWTTAEYLADRLDILTRLVPTVTTFYINHRFLVQSLDEGFNWATALHQYGIKCDAWTLDVGNPAAEINARRLLAAGVDQFTSNTPAAMKAFLEQP